MGRKIQNDSRHSLLDDEMRSQSSALHSSTPPTPFSKRQEVTTSEQRYESYQLDNRGDHKGQSLLVNHHAQESESSTHLGEEKTAPGRLPTWRPMWLRRITHIAFGCSFLVCVAALVPLVIYSQHNTGFTVAHEDLSYLWRFGPTAILTLLSVFWARVEFQAIRYMPWSMFDLHDQQSMKSDILSLDYTSMIPLVVLVESFKRKHFLLFLTVLVSILLKVQIVLSPSLFYSESIRDQQAIPIRLLSGFNATSDLSNRTDSVPYYTAKAVRDFNVSLPFGVSSEYVYQTFQSAEPFSEARGTVNSPITAVMDAVSTDMECLPLTNFSLTKLVRDEDWLRYNFSMEIGFEGCHQSISLDSSLDYYVSTSNFFAQTLPKSHDACPLLPQQFPSFVYVGQYWEFAAQQTVVPKLRHCVAVLCAPTANLLKVEVFDDGINPKIAMVPDQENKTIPSNPWAMIQNSMPYEWYEDGGSIAGPVKQLLELNGHLANDTKLALELTAESMLQAVMNLTRILAPLVSHYHLREESNMQTTGTRIFTRNRLHVNKSTCIAMISLSAIAAVIAFWNALQSHRVFKPRFRDPSTLIGSLITLRSLRLPPEAVKTAWSESVFSPIALKTWLRVLFIVYSLGLIIGLAITFNISQTSEGIIFVGPYTKSFWWTSIPGVTMLLVALYTTSSDTAIRDLSTLSRLYSVPCHLADLNRPLSDMLGMRALFYSVSLGIYSITLTQSLAILCGFLNPISAVLFTAKPITNFTHMEFEPRDWLGSRAHPSFLDLHQPELGYIGNRDTLKSLLLTQDLFNITWPGNTYGDLIFPSLGIDEIGRDWTVGTPLTINTSAVRLAADCSRLTDNFRMNMTKGDGKPDSIRIYYTQNFTRSDSFMPYEDYREIEVDAESVDSVYWAYQFSISESNQTFLSYGWGKFSVAINESEHHSIWKCDYSWIEAPVVLNYIWADDAGFQIDHSNPPLVDNGSRKPYPTSLSLPVGFSYLLEFNGLNITSERFVDLDQSFQTILEPFGPVQLEDFEDPSKDEIILKALNDRYGLGAAQLINLENRLGLDEKAVRAPFEHGELLASQATIKDNSRQRLTQNPIPTIILIAILSLACITNLWGLISSGLRTIFGKRRWLLDLELKGVAPDKFNSIGMMNALFEYSNLIGTIPESLLSMNEDGLLEQFEGPKFRIGWFLREQTGQSVFTIGTLGEDHFRFQDDKRQ